ncbi:hypothetical protein K2X89_08815 [Myxococcota bacterium]|nr:hypothetical protein [Myxococcota bacterium]
MSHRLFSRFLVIRLSSTVRAPRAGGGPSRSRSAVTVLAALSLATSGVRAESAPGAGAPIQSLDEQVQEIKSDVLAIATELGNLEEKLLFPSDSQLALFVEVEKGEPVEVDSARITVDGQLVAQHVYSWKELEALAAGGVQRIHTGNVTTGKHRLEVAISGRRGGDKPFEVVEHFDFSKEVGPRKIGIRLAHGATGGATVQIEAW